MNATRDGLPALAVAAWAVLGPLGSGCERSPAGREAATQPSTQATATAPTESEWRLPDMEVAHLPMALQTKIGEARYRVRQDPNNPNLVATVGAFAFVWDYPQVAVACFKRAAALEPTKMAWWYYLGRSCEKAGHQAEALEAYEKALAIEDHPQCRARLAALRSGTPLAAGIVQPASRVPGEGADLTTPDQLDFHLRLQGMDPDAIADVAVWRAKQANFVAAEQALKDLFDLDETGIKVRTAVGLVVFLQGRIEEAQREFEAVLAMPGGKEYIPAVISLTTVLTYRRDYDRAEPLLRELLPKAPHSAQAINSLAWILAVHPDPSRRRPEEAVELAERAAKLTGYAEHSTLDTLAVTYAAAGRFEDAKKWGAEALKIAGSAEKLPVSVVNEYRQRLALYEAGKAYVERRP